MSAPPCSQTFVTKGRPAGSRPILPVDLRRRRSVVNCRAVVDYGEVAKRFRSERKSRDRGFFSERGAEARLVLGRCRLCLAQLGGIELALDAIFRLSGAIVAQCCRAVGPGIGRTRSFSIPTRPSTSPKTCAVACAWIIRWTPDWWQPSSSIQTPCPNPLRAPSPEWYAEAIKAGPITRQGCNLSPAPRNPPDISAHQEHWHRARGEYFGSDGAEHQVLESAPTMRAHDQEVEQTRLCV